MEFLIFQAVQKRLCSGFSDAIERFSEKYRVHKGNEMHRKLSINMRFISISEWRYDFFWQNWPKNLSE